MYLNKCKDNRRSASQNKGGPFLFLFNRRELPSYLNKDIVEKLCKQKILILANIFLVEN